MPERPYSNYQKQLIGRYYENLDSIMLQKLQEVTTDLYLANSDARLKQLWTRAEKAMKKLKIHPDLINHIMKKRSAEVLAANLQDWLKQSRKKSRMFVSWGMIIKVKSLNKYCKNKLVTPEQIECKQALP